MYIVCTSKKAMFTDIPTARKILKDIWFLKIEPGMSLRQLFKVEQCIQEMINRPSNVNRSLLLCCDNLRSLALCTTDKGREWSRPFLKERASRLLYGQKLTSFCFVRLRAQLQPLVGPCHPFSSFSTGISPNCKNSHNIRRKVLLQIKS